MHNLGVLLSLILISIWKGSSIEFTVSLETLKKIIITNICTDSGLLIFTLILFVICSHSPVMSYFTPPMFIWETAI